MKKKIAILILGLTVALFVGACGNKDNSTEPTETTKDTAVVQENNKQDCETEQETETQEVETQETSEENNYWEQVGISDEIGTVYNGEKVELVRHGENACCIYAGYEFEESADFEQFANVDICYQDVDIKLQVEESRNCKILLSGNYELEELGSFNNECGKYYNLMVNGSCIAWIDVEGDSPETALENCKVNGFTLYPVEGMTLNGYEFNDLQMCNVVNYFGNPNSVVYYVFDEGCYDIDYGNEQILYSYREVVDYISYSEKYEGLVSYDNASSLDFFTKDGKSIDTIQISLLLSREEIQWQKDLEQQEVTTEKNE